MQITRVEVVPMELRLRLPYRAAHHARTAPVTPPSVADEAPRLSSPAGGDERAGSVDRVGVIFVRIETRQGEVAWGCAAFDPAITGETLEGVAQTCRVCGDRARDLNPLNLEYALAQLAPLAASVPSALCAFDIAFHDLLGLSARLPLYRILGGYRDRIQTSITLDVGSVKETVAMARQRAAQGFRILKLKGGLSPAEDVRRVHAVHDALPNLTLRLDADQGYTVQEALDVTRALEGWLEMLEQPTPAADLDALSQVTQHSPVPILADESVLGPPSALELASRRAAHGLSVKLATCGGLRCARQIDAIARAARMTMMVGCVHEPALLIAAGLCFALSSPSVQYGDLDGHFDLVGDPTIAGFHFHEGWLIATDVPGLGCTVDL